jgi:nitrogenase molybdenum-iron protein alpha/beta subunit
MVNSECEVCGKEAVCYVHVNEKIGFNYCEKCFQENRHLLGQRISEALEQRHLSNLDKKMEE